MIMKAKELIKILEQNPEMEVKFYNPIVEDWMDIKIMQDTLVKEKPSERLKLVNNENKKLGLPIETNIKTEWEFQNEYTETRPQNFTKKKVLIIIAKPRNKTSFGRTINISY